MESSENKTRERLIAGTYRHYKGNLYEVIGTTIHSETLEEMVMVNGEQMARFQFIDKPSS